jgi:hypothetical protein
LQLLMARWEGDSSLLQPDQVYRRLEVLDDLDARFGDTHPEGLGDDPGGARIERRVQAIRTKLEAANSEWYESVRCAIRQGAARHSLLQWIEAPTGHRGTGRPWPGLGYDCLDELVSGILQLPEPSEAVQAGPEMVFYQPTPVRHILELIKVSAIAEDDVLVDLGSGLGHVPLLAAMLTGARGAGIEVEAGYVRSARECARSLCLSRVMFVQEDARTADLSGGTVFYLYTPFTGAMLARVLERLGEEAARRPIRIGTLGPCTWAVAREPWLQASAPPDTEQITLFQSLS